MKTSSELAAKPARVATIAAVLVALTAAVFAQTLGHDFVNYDDPSYVYEVPRISSGLSFAGIVWAFTHIHAQNWHPLTTISHMLDCQMYGLRAGSHHLTNVLLHAAAAVLLFLGLRHSTGATWRSAIVAAVFAVHPLRVESVAWIAERKDVLSGVMFMLTLCSYARYVRRPSVLSYATVAVCVALGLMSKPMLVTLPAVLLLLDFWPLRRLKFASGENPVGTGRLLLEKLPLLLLVAGACAATLAAQSQYIGIGENLPWGSRINNAAVSYLIYARQMFWPAGLVPFYPHPEGTFSNLQVIGAYVALAAITVATVWQRRRRPYLLVGWLWYVGMLVPVIGFVQVGWQGHADRYTYLPQIGLCIAFVWGAEEFVRNSRVARSVAASFTVLVILGLTSAAWKQTTYWRNSETLWRRTLAVIPNNDVAHNNLGVALLAKGDEAAAREHFEAALRIRPDNVPAHTSLANALIHDGDLPAGLAHLQRVLELEPGNSGARDLFAFVLLQQGDVPGALREWERSAAADANDGNARSNLAWVYATNPEASVRNGSRAVTLAREAVELSGRRNALVLRTLAAALAESGEFTEAATIAKQAESLAVKEANQALAAELEATIALYQSGQPLRDPGQASPAP